MPVPCSPCPARTDFPFPLGSQPLPGAQSVRFRCGSFLAEQHIRRSWQGGSVEGQARAPVDAHGDLSWDGSTTISFVPPDLEPKASVLLHHGAF